MKHRDAKRLLALALVLSALPAAADWTHAATEAGSGGAPDPVASVRNDDGHRLSLFLSDSGQLMGVFALPVGLLSLDTRGCPTYSVDDQPIEALHLPEGRCVTRSREAQVEIASIYEGAVDSLLVLQLLNGEQLTVRYRLDGAGYRETRFTLRGSKQALTATLPQGTVIVGD